MNAVKQAEWEDLVCLVMNGGYVSPLSLGKHGRDSHKKSKDDRHEPRLLQSPKLLEVIL